MGLSPETRRALNAGVILAALLVLMGTHRAATVITVAAREAVPDDGEPDYTMDQYVSVRCQLSGHWVMYDEDGKFIGCKRWVERRR